MNGVNNVAISIGYFLGYILGWISNNFFSDANYNYMLPFGAGFAVSIVQLIWIKLVFPYETPKYLLSNDRVDEARKVIEIIYLPEYR